VKLDDGLHPWRVSYREAVAIQERLRGRVRAVPLERAPRLVAGTDVAYSRATHRMYAAVVVLDAATLDEVERATAIAEARWPYIPGLFSFREMPPLLEALREVRRAPDLFLVDGQGFAHPRRFGLACHLGLIVDRPTIGCAKTRLLGEHRAVGPRRGDVAVLEDGGEVIGAVLRTREAVTPVYVSVGHRIDLDGAAAQVLALAPRYRLPEPIRRAHRLTTEIMRRGDASGASAADRRYADYVVDG
jgi:deoxyribonuclease V